MLRLLNNLFSILLCVIFFISCEFIDLRQIGLSIEPDKTDSVLPEIYSPVIIKFDTEMKKRETEGILQINSNLGITSGDKFWIGNTLYFVPEAGWTAGICYKLNFCGTIYSTDGRETRIEKYLSFYAINKNNQPSLESYAPLNGASVGTNKFTFELHFSKPMDRHSVESALTIDGIGNKTYEWSDNKILIIKTDKNLSPWVYYRWNLKDSAKSDDGVPLIKTYSGYFITDLDQILPEITNIYPVLFSSGSWYPTGADIETGLGSGQGIAVAFNKPMEENVLRSLRFEPSLSGRAEYLSEKSIVYIFTKDPEPEVNYTLIISGDTKDCEGLKIGSEFRITFSVDIPYLNLLSFSVNDITIENFSDSNIIIPVKITQGTEELLINIKFSLPFNIKEKQNSPQKIILMSIFPRTLSPVALQYIKWISDDCLLLRWEGMTNGKNDIPNYYKIIIPGGKNGIVLENGSYLKEDIVLYLEAVE